MYVLSNLDPLQGYQTGMEEVNTSVPEHQKAVNTLPACAHPASKPDQKCFRSFSKGGGKGDPMGILQVHPPPSNSDYNG